MKGSFAITLASIVAAISASPVTQLAARAKDPVGPIFVAFINNSDRPPTKQIIRVPTTDFINYSVEDLLGGAASPLFDPVQGVTIATDATLQGFATVGSCILERPGDAPLADGVDIKLIATPKAPTVNFGDGIGQKGASTFLNHFEIRCGLL
jgi:hypothetical protein